MRNYTISTINSVFNVQSVTRIERSMGMMEFFVNYGDNLLPILIIPEQEIISIEAPQQPSMRFGSGVSHSNIVGGTTLTNTTPVANFGNTEAQPF